MDSKHYNSQKLAELREAKNWTQDYVAKELKVVRETIVRVENGKNASYEILCAYTALLGINVTDILKPRPAPVAA